MKKIFTIPLLVIIILSSYNVYPQLTGIKTIPGDYTSIADAVTALNSSGVGSGGVTFNIAAGHTETASNIVIAITANQPTESNPVIFQKSGAGANPLITAAPGVSQNLDGIIKLSGADYITFDGIDLLDPPSNTGDAMMEWGYALLRNSPTDGCQNVTIKNCVITLQKINVVSSTVFSAGIYVANRDLSGTTVNATDPAGQNSYNRFFGNTISNVYKGMLIISSSTARDIDNQVGVFGEDPNVITNWGGSNQTAEGIRCEGQINVKISNNIINGGAGTTSTVYGIIATLFGAAAVAPNYEISHNQVTITANTTTSLQRAIRALATGDTVRIHNNIVENCIISGTSATFMGIIHDPTGATNAAYIHNNIVRNNNLGTTGDMTLLGSTGTINHLEIYDNEIYENQKTGASGNVYCIRAENGNVNVYSNQIYNNSMPVSSGTTGSAVIGYYNTGNTAVTENVFNNTIHNLSVGGSSTSGNTVTYGIYSVPTLSSSTVVKNIYGNVIHGFASTVGYVGGIFQQYGTSVQIHKNNIYNLSTASTNNTSFAAGIIITGVLTGAGVNVTAYNNFISDLRTPASSNPNGVIGINSMLSASGTSVSLYYNTIYLNASSTGANFGSSGISAVGNASATSAVLEMKNNIIINESVPAGSGLTVAFRRSNENLENYSLESNNNDFYAGTPSANRLIFYDGLNSDQTLAEYKLRVVPRDSSSISKAVIFEDALAGDLHLAGASVGDFDLVGIPISGITTDIDDDVRHETYPYIGADEAEIPLPAELVSLNAVVNGNNVLLSWSTASETNNQGFEIHKTVNSPQSVVGSEQWNIIGFVEGNGTTTEMHSYSFIDVNPFSGKSYYRLKQIDFDGSFEYSQTIEVDVNVPLNFALEQNYPNPFNPATNIKFSLPVESEVTIKIFNLLGQEVAEAVNGNYAAGSHTVAIDGSSLSSGLYFYTINAVGADKKNFTSTKKMLLMK
jgi:trimeric autotransporter adhesin